MSLDDYMRQNMLTGTQRSDLDKPISFADIMRQIGGPWGLGATVPHHFRSCEIAAEFLMRKAVPMEPTFSGFTVGGMKVIVDKTLPLGRVQVCNAAGGVIQEIEISADALTK